MSKIAHSCLMLTESLNDLLAEAKHAGCDVTRDKEAGTVMAWDYDDDAPPVAVIKAIQKGHLQPWIVTFHDSGRISWRKKSDCK